MNSAPKPSPTMPTRIFLSEPMFVLVEAVPVVLWKPGCNTQQLTLAIGAALCRSRVRPLSRIHTQSALPQRRGVRPRAWMRVRSASRVDAGFFKHDALEARTVGEPYTIRDPPAPWGQTPGLDSG